MNRPRPALDHPVAGHPQRSGFTLFEVGISLLLVSFGVVSVLMVFPVGLKQTQASRYKVLAATKAVEIIDTFASTLDETRNQDVEVPEAWEGRTFAYSNSRWDLEQHTCNFRYGIHPLPNTIARRLDSDGNEIQRILDEGGQLYYCMPMANTNLDERWAVSAPMNETKSMVFAVVGSPQHNALPRLPQKAWPYHYPYPSPPMYADGGYYEQCYKPRSTTFWKRVPYKFKNKNGDLIEKSNSLVCLEWWLGGIPSNPSHVLTNQSNDALESLFTTYLDYAYDHDGDQDINKTINETSNRKPPKNNLRKKYVEAAIGYCKDVFEHRLKPLSSSATGSAIDEFNQFYLSMGQPLDNTLQSNGQTYDKAFAEFCREGEILVPRPLLPTNPAKPKKLIQTRVEAALRVQCMRYLAHAMATLSEKGKIRQVEIQDEAAKIESSLLGPSTIISGYTITPAVVRYLHERSLFMGMRYAASFPYDWGQPRPQQRMVMNDVPLLELDLFSSPRTGRIGGTIEAAQWRAIPAQTISNLGPSSAYPGTLDKDANWSTENFPYPEWDNSDATPENMKFWGDPNHFTLTKTFEAAERCRQLVFWSVDWQTYEDFELAPAAAMDASRHPFLGPMSLQDPDNRGTISTTAKRLSPRLLENSKVGMNNQYWRVADNYSMFHPELRMLFTRNIKGGVENLDDFFKNMPTGTNIAEYDVFNSKEPGSNGEIRNEINEWGQKDLSFCGLWGADRNFNRVLDRGPVSSNVRLRASQIAKFNFYDPRIPIVTR